MRKIVKKALRIPYIIRILHGKVKYAIHYKKDTDAKIADLENKIEWLKEHSDLCTLKPAKGYLRKRQLDTVAFAKDFFEEIEELNIFPFMMAGNLLGQIRNKSFIPWDDDLDFGLIRNEYEKLKSFCEEKFNVCISDKEDVNLQSWIDLCTRRYAGEYILFVYDNQIQISKGTSVIDRQALDFFAFDFMKEIDFKEYAEYVDKIEMEINSQHSILDKYNIVREKIKEDIYSTSDSQYIYFGLDNMETFKRKFNTSWMQRDTLFPLKKEKFEGEDFWVPNNKEEFIKYEYQDYKSFPSDFGVETHNYWDDYKRNNLICIEFYLIDSFEIFHFIPLYNLFRKNGIWAIFIAESPQINTAEKWFDYENAIKILEELQVEYKEKCNPYADYAFTTQDAYILKKYKTSTKVNMSYGYGLIKDSFAFSDRTTNGFDLRLVHGEFQRRILQKFINDDCIMVIGFPKHYNSVAKSQCEIKKRLNIISDKPILVYFPTWDEDCSVLSFANEINTLREHYYVVTKMHHVLQRDKAREKEREKIFGISDLVLECNSSFEDAALLADVALCDAKSGASLEVPYLNCNVKLVLLSQRKDLENNFYSEIYKVAPVVNNPLDLIKILTVQVNINSFDERQFIIDDCLGKKNYDYLSKLLDKIKEENV